MNERLSDALKSKYAEWLRAFNKVSKKTNKKAKIIQ